MFYVPDLAKKNWYVVMPGKKRIVGVENVIEEEEYNQFDEIPSFDKPYRPNSWPVPALRFWRPSGELVATGPLESRLYIKSLYIYIYISCKVKINLLIYFFNMLDNYRRIM